MSSFYDDASLVVIPSGYKTSKVYAEKPTDGSGDLAFTRTGDTATRVASNGLIERVRTNYARQSQSFATAAVWSATNGTLTNNAGTAPDGTNTASKIVATNTDPFCYQSITLTGPVVASCYVKAVGSSIGKNAEIRAGVSLTTFTLSGSWQRVSVTHTASGAHNYGLEVPNPGVIGDEVLLWGFQVEGGDVVTDYIFTTTAAVSVGPVANVPRLDYLGSTCPRLLLEPQRTNSLTYSEQFDNAAWTKLNATVTANTSVSPDGYTNADTVVITSGGYLYRQITGYSAVSGQSVAYSVFAKNQTSNFLIFGGATPAGTDVYKIENYGNGWYRHSVVRTFTTTTTGTLQYLIGYEIVGTHIIWGAQIETSAAYATSYIPTLAASVTRGFDFAYKTGISSLIGQTEGTVFWELDVKIPNASANESTVNIDNGAFGDTIYLYKSAGGQLSSEIYVSGVVQASFATSTISAGKYKLALAYANNNSAFFVNGVQVGSTDTSCSIPATSRIQMGATAISNDTSTTAQVLLFKTRLTNAQLAELTTL